MKVIFVLGTMLVFCLQVLAQISEETDHKAEERAIAEARRTLSVLERDKLQFPDWETQ